jgi:hypothetical protein
VTEREWWWPNWPAAVARQRQAFRSAYMAEQAEHWGIPAAKLGYFTILPSVTVTDGGRPHPARIARCLGVWSVVCTACGWDGFATTRARARADAKLHEELQQYLEGS